MVLEFHNRKKKVAPAQATCEQLSQRWGSVERIAGSVSRAGARGGRGLGRRLVVVGVAVAVGATCLVPLRSSRPGTPSGGNDAAGQQAQGDSEGSIAMGREEGQTPTPSGGDRGGDRALSLGDAIKRTEPAIVQLNTFTKSGQPLSIGTGFLIHERGWVATNYHVVRAAARAQAQFRDGSNAEVEGLVAQNELADLAIIALASPPRGMRPLELRLAPPPVGESVFAMGHPQGLSFSVTTGNVGALRRTADFPPDLAPPSETARDTLWVQSNAAIAGGSSGGPLCDSQGRVVGVNSWLAVRENFAFAVHVGHLQSLMNAAPEKLVKLPGNRPVGELDNPLAPLEPRIQQMWQEFLFAESEFRLQLLRARTPQEQEELFKTQSPRPKYAERFLRIADSERKTTAGFQALFFACQMHLPGGDDGHLKRVVERLGEDHLADRGLHLLFRQLAGSGHAVSAAFLTKALEQNPHRQVQGAACYFLANWLLAQGKPEQNAEALRLLERCAKDFADVKVDGGALGPLALRDGFRARFLSVGAKAQEIQGNDVEGKPLKLSEFRGKVVLIDFFADWCPHCVAMYPHEQQLVKRYADKPFALLGVNGDSPDTLRQITTAGKVKWRCWNDGQNGPIAQQWQIGGTYPTLFLLDAQGVIRQIFVGRPMPEEQLDDAIDKLLAEAEKGAGAKKEASP